MLKFERPSLVSRKMAQQWILRRLEVLGLLEVKDRPLLGGKPRRKGGQQMAKDGLEMDLEMFPPFVF